MKQMKRMKSAIAVFLVCMILIGMLPATAKAAALSIRYDGKTVTYTGSQTKITIDGKNVDLKGTPGILIDNTNMVSYYDVFRTALKASTSYNSSTKKVSIKFYDITVEMTVGSKTAYVNGKAKTMDVAPKSIYFASKKKTKIYVPAGFVAQALGCGYQWNSSQKAGQITSPYIIRLDEKWIAYTGTQGKVTYNGKKVNVDDIPSILVDNTALLSVARVFKTGLGASYSYDSQTKQITVSQNGKEIIMTVGSREAIVNGDAKALDTAPRVIKVKATGKSYVMVPGKFVATNLGYAYNWNSSTGTSMITKTQDVFFEHYWNGDALGLDTDANLMTSLKALANSSLDQIIIGSRFAITPVITEDSANSCLYIDIPGVYNGIEGITETIAGGNYMEQISLAPAESGIRITVYLKKNSEYYTMESNTTTTIVLCGSDNSNISTDYEMKVSVPGDVAFSSVKTEDHYESNYFTITIPGDWSDYFASNPIVFNSDVLSKVSYSLNSSGNTVIKAETYKLQGFRLHEGDGFIGVNVGNPTDIYDSIVVLDAGHGGTDAGASNGKANEKALTLKIVYTLAKKYFDSSDSPVKAYWTRTSDKYVSLNDRAAFADKVGADVFISLHMNSASSTSAKGTEVLYAQRNANTLGAATSKTIAKRYADYLTSTLGTTGRTNTIVDRPNLVVLYKNTVPAILIELGFMSNSSDYKKLADESFQDQAAKAIYDATVALFQDYPTGR